MMRIALGSDHRGLDLRRKLAELLSDMGHEIHVVEFNESEPVDYPEIASTVCRRIRDRFADRGILICGTGIGMCVAANKFPGVRAAPCYDTVMAEMSRKHNDANVLCLSSGMLGLDASVGLVLRWLETSYEGGRHEPRLEKIRRIENGETPET